MDQQQQLDRERAIALLEANHRFPGEFSLSVIAVNVEAVTTAVRGAAEHGLGVPLADSAHEIIPSRGGKYLSHRLKVPCHEAEDVLRLYARMRAIEGVITVL